MESHPDQLLPIGVNTTTRARRYDRVFLTGLAMLAETF
jgi:hypothetical protein